MKETGSSPETSFASIAVRDALTLLREAFGTASPYLLSKELNQLAQDPSLSLQARQALDVYRRNTRRGIPRILVDAIVERRLPTAPEDYAGLDSLRMQANCSIKLIHELLPGFLRVRGFSPEVLTDIPAWRAAGEPLRAIFLHARSPRNGNASLFFSPQAQQDFLRYLDEHRRSIDDSPFSSLYPIRPTPAQTKPPVRPAHREVPRIERAPVQNPVAPLLRRLAAIMEDLPPREQAEVAQIQARLTQNEPIPFAEGIAYAKRTQALELVARQNRED